MEGNPILAIAKMILFQKSPVFIIDRPEKFGGRLEFTSYEELESTYVEGKLHPMDLKIGVAKALSEQLQGAREYFQRNPQNLDAMRRSLGII